MLTLWGPGRSDRYCDGRSRRSFLKLGGLAMGGLGLPGLLQAEAQAREATPTGSRSSGSPHKSVIMIYLAGGLAHQDTFDLKPDAPDGIRGEFKPIATRLPGVQIGEHLPRIAGIMDKVAVIRSIVGLRDEHSSFQNVTGFPMGQSQREGKPSFGSVIARVKGPVDPVVPPFIDLFPVMQHKPYNSPGPGFLGHSYKAARMEGDDLALLKPPANVPPPRFDRRKALLDQFDQFRRSIDNAEVGGMDERLPPGLRRPDLRQGRAGAGPVTRGSPAARPLRPRLARHAGRRRADAERPVPDRPPPGRGRGAVRDGRLRLLGHARR